jgi:hypothetical protein
MNIQKIHVVDIYRNMAENDMIMGVRKYPKGSPIIRAKAA